MDAIYHITSIPSEFVEHEEKISSYSKKELEKYAKTEEYRSALICGMPMRGTYSSKELALNAIKEHGWDIYEYYYTYLVVEKFQLNTIDGVSIHDDSESEIWFRWNDEDGEYVQIEKPKCLKHIKAFAQ